MASSAAGLGAYRKVDIETASQGKLIVMMYNGAIQRAEEAKRHMEKRDYARVHSNLIRAQDIIAELRSALNMDIGEIARNLDRLYEYAHHLLVQANIHKDAGAITECVVILTQLRDTWKEVFDKLAKESSPKPPPQVSQHGAAAINVQG